MPNTENYYSETTSEIMGKMPSWIIRYGIVLFTVLFIIILLGCWVIKYPQILESSVVITTANPPADLVARYEGRIDKIFVKDGELVLPREQIAVLETPGDYISIFTVERELLSSIKEPFYELVNQSWIEQEYMLGELQASYAFYQRLSLEYKAYLDIGHIEKKKNLLKELISKNIEYSEYLEAQNVLTDKEMVYSKKGYRRDSSLYASRAISASEMEKSTKVLLQEEKQIVVSRAGLVSVEIEMMQMEQQLIELDIQYKTEILEQERNLSQSRQELLAAISKWKEQYLIISPIKGRITFINHWSSNQRINVGERLASIISDNSPLVIGRLSIPTSGFGKIEEGQIVNVKLNGYPYMEFGVLKGIIASISAVPDDENNYQAEVYFPDGLITTYRKELNLIQQMDGVAEIITDDMRLIEHFVRPIRALFSR